MRQGVFAVRCSLKVRASVQPVKKPEIYPEERSEDLSG